MLIESVEANIPLVYVQTDDLIHIGFVLRSLFPEHEVETLGTKPDPSLESPAFLYYHVHDNGKLNKLNFNDCYSDAEKNEYTIVFVNGVLEPQMMDCGVLLPDADTVHSMLHSALPKEIVDASTDHLVGLTVQQIKEVIPLASVIYGRLSSESLRKTKEMLFMNQVGITKIESKSQFFYPVETNLMLWVQDKKDYMFIYTDPRLTPKGLLLHGEPGTGKTEFAKHIAREWEIPLFLLDVNAMLSKWQGEAEAHLSTALKALDNASPCIILFDEVEKLFTSNSENDTSQRLLGKILWWLQYKTSRVLVVMTCNNMKVIPPELHRAGRINMTVEMKGIPRKTVPEFAKNLLESFAVPSELKTSGIARVANILEQSNYTGAQHVPQALVSEWIVNYLISKKYGL